MIERELMSEAENFSLADIALIRYVERHPTEVAAQLAEHPISELRDLCGLLPHSIAAQLVAQLPDSLSDKLIATAPPETLSHWIAKSHPDDAAAILGRLNVRQRRHLLKHEEENRVLLERLSDTASDSFAQTMQVDFLRINLNATLSELIVELKRLKKTAYRSIFVVDERGRYHGIIDLSKALIAEPESKVQQLYRSAQPILIDSTLTKALRTSSWNLHRELAVVDEQNRLIASLQWSDLQDRLRNTSNRYESPHNINRPFYRGLELFAKLITPLVDALAGKAHKS